MKEAQLSTDSNGFERIRANSNGFILNLATESASIVTDSETGRTDSSGFERIRAESNGFEWIRTDSSVAICFSGETSATASKTSLRLHQHQVATEQIGDLPTRPQQPPQTIKNRRRIHFVLLGPKYVFGADSDTPPPLSAAFVVGGWTKVFPLRRG